MKPSIFATCGGFYMDAIGTVLGSEFFWGVVVGVVLTGIGAWGQAVFTVRQQRKAQKDLIKNFCIDTVENIKAIVDDMVNHRQWTQTIHPDHLALLDIEIGVFGRNREHIIHLPDLVRENVRKFVTDCAIRRAEIVNNLSQFDSLMALANQLQSQGEAQQAQQVRTQRANVPLARAHQALDQLVIRVSGSADLVNRLKAAG
jgi:hypothetical protein